MRLNVNRAQGAFTGLVCFTDKSQLWWMWRNVKKRSDSCGEREDCEEAIWLLFRCGGLEYWFWGGRMWDRMAPNGTKKCHSFRATVITHNQYVQINTGIPEKVITETLGHKSSKVLWCYRCTSSIQQWAVTASINRSCSIVLFSCKLLFA